MTTAFVLSSGGSLGAVQVGMLQALAERGITPDLHMGTSAGPLNAVFAAAHERVPPRSTGWPPPGRHCDGTTSSRSGPRRWCSPSAGVATRCAATRDSNAWCAGTCVSPVQKTHPSRCTWWPPICCQARRCCSRTATPSARSCPAAPSRPYCPRCAGMGGRSSMADWPTTRPSPRRSPSAPTRSTCCRPGTPARSRHHRPGRSRSPSRP
jgi:hypothetical protein